MGTRGSRWVTGTSEHRETKTRVPGSAHSAPLLPSRRSGVNKNLAVAAGFPCHFLLQNPKTVTFRCMKSRNRGVTDS